MGAVSRAFKGESSALCVSMCTQEHAREGLSVFLLSSLAPGRDERLLSLQLYQLFLGPTHSSTGTQAKATLVYIPRARGHHHQQFKGLSPKQQTQSQYHTEGHFLNVCPRGDLQGHTISNIQSFSNGDYSHNDAVIDS